ncbi:MAG: hypothetical protein NTV79_07775 [Candidatus Aureabacteria bacterium]|nr:hypothetical protein [Candidatus Auribacterota bacterium]
MKPPPHCAESDRGGFLAQIGDLWPAAKGSVAEIRKPCMRPGCPACAEGRKHRAFILSYKDGTRRRCLYVPAQRVEALRRAIANGRRIERLLSQAGAQMVIAHRRRKK